MVTRFWANAGAATAKTMQSAAAGRRSPDNVAAPDRLNPQWDKANSDLCCAGVEDAAGAGLTR